LASCAVRMGLAGMVRRVTRPCRRPDQTYRKPLAAEDALIVIDE